MTEDEYKGFRQQTAIMQRLEANRPRWWLEWASADDLRDLIEKRQTQDAIKQSLYLRYVLPSINAAVEAGEVKLP